jgi:AcrR family transcriptional regulator
MTAKRIKEVALAHFANYGYEGASLADIAVEVGIKTPSIYSHYKGKDDLFLTVMKEIAISEFQFIIHFFEGHKHEPLDYRLYHYLLQSKQRYEQHIQTKLWLRIAFFPPAHLHDQMISSVYSYLDQVETLLIPIFQQAFDDKSSGSVDAEQATIAYMGVWDSMLVEMLYGGPERALKRLEASWQFYWRGISLQQ